MKKKKIEKLYKKEEKRHDAAYEKENKRHEKMHDKEMNEAYKSKCDKGKKKRK